DDCLGTKPQRCRSPRVPGGACVRIELQVRNRRPGRFQQRDRLSLCVERVESLCLSGLPAAGLLLAGQKQGCRGPLVLFEVAAADLEQAGGAAPPRPGGGRGPRTPADEEGAERTTT